MADYKATHESALHSIPAAVQIEEVFGDVDHFITHYGMGLGDEAWGTNAYFGGRFKLAMQVPIDVDYDARTVQPTGEPKFYLFEVDSIQVKPNGTPGATYKRQRQAITADEWRTLYESRGDVSSIGFDNTLPAVENFDLYKKGWLKDRIPIRLLED